MKKEDLIYTLTQNHCLINSIQDEKGYWVVGYGTPSFEGDSVDGDTEAKIRLESKVDRLYATGIEFGLDEQETLFLVKAHLGRKRLSTKLLSILREAQDLLDEDKKPTKALIKSLEAYATKEDVAAIVEHWGDRPPRRPRLAEDVTE